MMNAETALVLEGGGFRGIFTAGVLEVFLEHQIDFGSVWGVSAGSAYGVSYASKQMGRNIEVNGLIGDRRYCSWNNWMKEGSMFSWDFVYGEVPQHLIPFDYETLKNSPTDFWVGTTNCHTGDAEFFRLNDADKKDFKTILAASSSLPFIAPMVSHRDSLLMDGGLADSIPVEYALNQGYKKAVVILTQPKGFVKEPQKNRWIFKAYYRKYPKIYELLVSRAQRYNDTINQLTKLEKEGRVFIIRPEKSLEIKRIENNPQKTAAIYHQAIQQTQREIPGLLEWLGR